MQFTTTFLILVLAFLACTIKAMPTYVSANIDLDYVENLVKFLIECQHPPTQEEALASCPED